MCSCRQSIAELAPRPDLRAVPIKTAVFVDFDSIYRALGEWTFALTDRSGCVANAARTFATQPERWLDWIERGMPSLRSGARLEQQRRRSLLLRRCYLNPHFAAGSRSRDWPTSARCRAADTSTLSSRPCAWSLRTKATCRMPGSCTSSTNRARPVSRRASSLRRIRALT